MNHIFILAKMVRSPLSNIHPFKNLKNHVLFRVFQGFSRFRITIVLETHRSPIPTLLASALGFCTNLLQGSTNLTLRLLESLVCSSPFNWGIRCPVIRYNLRDQLDQPTFFVRQKRSSKNGFFRRCDGKIMIPIYPHIPIVICALSLGEKSLSHHPKQKTQHSRKFHLVRIC